MSYILDAETTMDVGDHRYWVTRIKQHVKVTRQLLKGDLDHSSLREEVSEEDIPSNIMLIVKKLRAGELPAVAAWFTGRARSRARPILSAYSAFFVPASLLY